MPKQSQKFSSTEVFMAVMELLPRLDQADLITVKRAANLIHELRELLPPARVTIDF